MNYLFLAILIVVALVLVTRLLRYRASRNVPRASFSRLLKTLIRLHKDDSRLEFIHMSSPLQLDVTLMNGDGTKCELLIRPTKTERLDESMIHAAIVSGQASLMDPTRPSLGLTVLISNIWTEDATETASQVMHRILDTLGIDASECFKVRFSGDRSLELLREANRRLKAGLLEDA